MASTIQLEIPTQEEAAAKLEADRLHNEARERARLAAVNRATGISEPKPGDRLYVTTARGIPQRSRAGCHFRETAKSTVLVVDEAESIGPIMEGDKPTGGYRVHAHGAEMILADTGLNVNAQGATEVEASDLRKVVAAKDAEIAALKTEHARQLRDARMAAKDDPNGGPARLRAARGVKPPEGEFGGRD